MLEETNTIEEQEVVNTIENENVEPQLGNEVETPMSELDVLIQRRMGNFEINISPADLKYVKNLLNNKVEWKGPNEAYLILMALLSLSSELKEVDDRSTERHTVSLPSTTLESINFFLGKVTGKGEEPAHRLFAVSMLLRPAMEQIRVIDETIEQFKSEKK
jgi:hypothetical protein